MSGEIKHEWDGPVLTVISDSGTSSSNLQGPKGDVGPRGPQGAPGVIYDAEGKLVIDLSPYATQETVDAAIANIPQPDMSNYASKNFVSTEIARAQLEGAGVDTSGFATKDDIANIEVEVDHQTIVVGPNGDLRTSIGGFANQGGGVDYKISGIEFEACNISNGYRRASIGNIGKPWVAGCLYYITMTFKDGSKIGFEAMFKEVYNKDKFLHFTMEEEYDERLLATQNRISSFYPRTSRESSKWLEGDFDFDFMALAEDYTNGSFRPQDFKYQDYVPYKWIVTEVTIEAKDYIPIDANYIPVDGTTIFVNQDGSLSCAVSIDDTGNINLNNYYTKEEVDKLILSINTGGGSGSSSPTYPSGEEVEY